MKSQPGFVQFYEALGMKVCLDPLHSVSARPTVDGTKNSPVYEAVNKESRKNFFIGMHNEFVGTRAPRAAAFVCFKSAETGGEFLIADGRQVFRDLKHAIFVIVSWNFHSSVGLTICQNLFAQLPWVQSKDWQVPRLMQRSTSR